MAVVLIGVPGAGKSTVGEILAKNLNLNFIDTDTVIEARANKTISDIFIQDGEPSFRELEKQVIEESLLDQNSVISVGGGALMNDQTRDLVSQQECVWLQTGLAKAVERVGMNRNRPLLLGNVRGQLADLMSAREPFYIECAKYTVDTDELNAQQVAEKIAALIKIEGK
jgi:shikimate kinase